MQWRNRKPNYQEHQKASFFFICLTFRIAFLFCFWGNDLFISYVLATTVLFVPVGKHSNSRSQMFCKVDALKIFAIFTGKHLGWRFILINFIKKRHQQRCFPVNVAKCLSTAFYIEHIPFIIFLRNFMWW